MLTGMIQSILTNILLSLKDFKKQRVRGWEKDINNILEQFSNK